MLEQIRSPKDLQGLSERELKELAEEIRSFLIETVSKTGGHLGPNLGVVEITLAMHRVFNSPTDAERRSPAADCDELRSTVMQHNGQPQCADQHQGHGDQGDARRPFRP